MSPRKRCLQVGENSKTYDITGDTIYKHSAPEIDAVIEKLPAGLRTAWKDTHEDKVNLAIISMVEAFYKKQRSYTSKSRKPFGGSSSSRQGFCVSVPYT